MQKSKQKINLNPTNPTKQPIFNHNFSQSEKSLQNKFVLDSVSNTQIDKLQFEKQQQNQILEQAKNISSQDFLQFATISNLVKNITPQKTRNYSEQIQILTSPKLSPKTFEKPAQQFFKQNNVPAFIPQQNFVKIQQQTKISISSFNIGKKLGSGRFGDVYLAREKQTGLKVALKQINKKNIQDKNDQENIVNELKALSVLNHPNIIKLYGYFYENDCLNIILELAPGKELFEELKEQVNKRYNEQTVSNYIKQLINILLYVHQQGIVHRDIKPENIKIQNGVIKLCDFGCAGVIQKNTMRQTYCGTLDYLSPEMAQGKSYDQSVDIWSTGILTYELLFGRSPFYNQNHNAIINEVINKSVQFGGPVSFEAADFIQKMLCKDPKERMDLKGALQHPFIANKKYVEQDIIGLNEQAFLYR